MASADETEETILRRRPFAIAAFALSFGYLLALLSRGADSGNIGVDFGVFYAGGKLISDRGYDAAYDPEIFTAYVAQDYPALGSATDSITAFISPPTFGWFAQALTVFPLEMSMIWWYVSGLVLIVLGCRMLELPGWAPVALAISPMMALNTTLGQTGAFVFFLFAAVHVNLRNERVATAGAIAGLMILKPPLALGYGLLWLIRLRSSAVAIGAALASGLVVSIPTILGGVGPWRTFISVMTDRTSVESDWPTQAASMAEFVKLLFPNSESWVTLLSWALGVVVAAAMLIAAQRRYGDDPEIMSAAAVIASAVGSPHLLAYDSLILVIPVAVAYRRGLLTGHRAGILALIMTVAFAVGSELYFLVFDVFSRGIGIEFPALLLCTYLLVRWESEQQAGSAPNDVSASISANVAVTR